MIYIDSVILNVTERACRRFQRLTGRTNVWLAVQLTNLSIIVYFVWAAVVFSSTDAGLRTLVSLFCAGLLYVLIQTLFRESIEAYENSAYRRVAKGFRNPRRVRDALLRISFLTFSVISYPAILVYVNPQMQVLILTYSLIVLTTAVLYLLACDPLPPCAGTLKDARRVLAAARMKPHEVEESSSSSMATTTRSYPSTRQRCSREKRRDQEIRRFSNELS